VKANRNGRLRHSATGHRPRTTLTILVQHTSQEHRDAHINSGMEGGLQAAMDLLEQVAISLT
jgi:uncharacterized protein YndB with AHSA1/START domain